MSGRRPTQSVIWIAALLAAMSMPWLFYNYHTGRHSGFVLSMLSQMGMMSILALSYNMLLGQAGLFSFCHATFFGIGGYATIHFLNMAGSGGLPAPMPLDAPVTTATFPVSLLTLEFSSKWVLR